MASSPARETWVDVAKGGAIVLVVLFHAALFLDDVGLAWLWPRAGTALDTFRMPLFFSTAGLFAAKTLALDLQTVLRRRVARLVWVYVLWSLVWTLAFQVLPLLRDVPEWRDLLLLLVWPNPSTWFVYALALYFVLAWALRPLPAQVQLTAAATVSAVFGAGTVATGNTALDKMGMYFVFFLTATLVGPWVRAAARRVRPAHAALAAGAYVLATGAVFAVGGLGVPGVRLAVGCLAVVFGTALAVTLAGRRGFRWLELLGGRTLPVYVLHYYPVLVLCALAEPVAPRLAWAAPALPLLLSAVAIVFSLLVHRVTWRVPGLYALPTLARPPATAVGVPVPARRRAPEAEPGP